MLMSRVTPAEIAMTLGPRPYADKCAAAAPFVARLDREFSIDAAAALLEALEPSSAGDRAVLNRWIAGLEPSPSVRYLQANIAAVAGDHEAAAAHWSALLGSAPCRDPFVCLQGARVFAQLAQWDAAALWLMRALEHEPPYAWFARAQRLLDQVLPKANLPARRVRIGVVGGSTTSLMVPIVRALCFRDGIAAELYEGLYGAFRQEILDPASGLAAFHPDILLIATHWRDLGLPPVVEDEAAAVERLAEEYRALWRTAAERFGCHVVQHAFDHPAPDSYGILAQRLPGSRKRVIGRLNLRMESDTPAYASVLDTLGVVARVGAEAWADSRLWHLSRQHPATAALPALAEEQVAHIKAAIGLSRKVVVCDLDNTLWGGVIGEDGIDGIQLDHSGTGEGHLELQRHLRELKDRGVLLAVCSKNNPDDARLPFEAHSGMVLRLDDFAAFVANWDDKVTNLRRLAATLRLGLDSFVVLDDNPLERAWIRAELPEVAVVELGPAAASYVKDLDRGRHFESLTWSAEDRMRTAQYRRERDVDTARANAGSLDAFLEGLAMRGACAPVSSGNIERVVQLTNKTNQFNLTTKRYTRPQVERLVAASGWQGVFRLADRYGDHGIIGVIFCTDADETGCWTVDTWLMSCRVLGRQFEEFMADAVIGAARERGMRTIVGEYRPTAKNGLVADLYSRLGFAPAGDTDAGKRYRLDVASAEAPRTRFIAAASASPLVTA